MAEVERVRAAVRLGRQVARVRGGEVHAGRAPARPPSTPSRVELRGLVGVVGEQRDPVDAERAQHLGGHGVVALVRGVAEGEVGLVGVEAGVLQRVGVELGVEPDAAALLPQVEQVAAAPRRSARPPRAAAGRSRSAGCRARRRSGTRCAAAPAAVPSACAGRGGRSPSPSARCSRPSTSPSKVNTRAVGRGAVGEPERQRHLACGRWRRHGGRHRPHRRAPSNRADSA